MWNWKGNELKVSAVGFRYLRQLVKLKALQFKIIFQSQPTNAFWNVILWSCKEISYFSRQPTSWHFERAINESILKTFEKCIVKEQVFFHLHWFSFSFFFIIRDLLYMCLQKAIKMQFRWQIVYIYLGIDMIGIRSG